MQCIRVAGFVVVLVLFTDVVVAQQELLDEPRRIEQITFSPATRASIRLTNGVRRTGRIVSITREKMVLQVGRNNNEVEIPIDEVQRVNTLDNEFTYEPADEDFERLKVKARRISYLSVQTVTTYDPPPEGLAEPPVDDTPPAVDPANPEAQPELRPESGLPTELDPSLADIPGPAAGPAPASDGTPDREPQPGDLVLFCSVCEGMLPLSIRNGDACPHCGKILWNVRPASMATNPQPPAGGGRADPGAPAYPTAPAAAQNGAAAVPSQPADGGGSVVARGTGLADIPVWMKVGFFVGMLAVCWLILQRR